MTNTNLLKAKMIEKGYTIDSLSKIIGISSTSLSYKINNKRQFTVKEIYNLCLVLDVSNKDIYFFNAKVAKMAT